MPLLSGFSDYKCPSVYWTHEDTQNQWLLSSVILFQKEGNGGYGDDDDLAIVESGDLGEWERIEAPTGELRGVKALKEESLMDSEA